MNLQNTNTARIILSSYDHRTLNHATKIVLEFLKAQKAQTSGVIPLPNSAHLISLRRDNFIYKESQEQFVYKVHKRIIELKYDENTNIFSSEQKLPLPSSVSVQIKLLNKKK